MRSIAFGDIVLLLICLDCLSFNAGGFWRVVACDFPLTVLLSLSLCAVMPLKRFVFDFAAFVGVFIWLNVFRAL